MPLSAPPVAFMTEVVLSTMSSRGSVGGTVGGANIAASATWPTNNLAKYMPLYVDRPGTVVKFWTYNGATASANIDIGLYRSDLTLIAAIGSTAQAGTNVIQEFDIADFAITQGAYFIGLVLSSTAGTIWRIQLTNVGYVGSFGVFQQTLAGTALPSTMTPAQIATATVPVCGISYRTLLA